ncbi:MAG: hypothetical protein U9532_00710 ['Conium maculatum' witches'-broom phytoplasma]|nr:hypothetical protein ['Conium maculatum' witches'-broom phytoplasma]
MNLFTNKNKIQLLPFVFNSVEGNSFREENCLFNDQEKKIEFFYLKQSKYNSFFLNMNQYVVWTYLNGVFRVLIHEEYYDKFNALYQKEINSFYMKFIYELLNKRANIIKKNFLSLGIGFAASLVLSTLIKSLITNLNGYKVVMLFALPIILFLIILMFFMKKNDKKFQLDKKKLFIQFIQESENFLGKEELENILTQHRLYRHVPENE